MQGIYMIKNIANGKVYVGKAKDIIGRWGAHVGGLLKNKHGNEHLQRAWNKYGEENFYFTILEEVELENQDEREKYWIQHCKSYDPQFGYNKTYGGEGGIPTEETLLKLKKVKNTKEFLDKNRDFQTGVSLPKELSKKIKASKQKNFKQFTRQEIEDIVKRRKNGEYYINIANDYGVCYNVIRSIVLENAPETKTRKTSKNTKSRSNGNFKLSDEEVREIKRLLQKGTNYQVLSEKYNVSKSTIKRIRLGTHYQWVE